MSIGRIGSADKISRDVNSAGLDAQNKTDSAKPERNEKVDAAAKMYEKAFLAEMVKAMRSTVDFGADKPSMAENIYRDQLDEQYVDSWGENGGIGLSDLIYNQVMEKYFAGQEGRQVKGDGGAIPLTDKDVSRVIRVKTADAPGQIPLRVELKKSDTPARVRAPWDGEVVSSTRLDSGKTALTLQHKPGLRSSLVFQGVAAADMRPGEKVEKGHVVGILSPEVHSFLWNINKTGLDPDGSRGL